LTQIVLERKTAASVDAVDRKEQRPVGRPPKPESDSKILSNIQDLPKAPAGTTQAAALRRLRKDRPDLHASHT
jgi:wyosine [tRNA(Phe)-imidazoG37] synthetase (radical SAM superfamily)